jgi:uncharacterized protein YfaS (alpha-2-macroglobulin family)
VGTLRGCASFQVNEDITSFAVRAEVLDAKGAIGLAQTTLATSLPFYVSFVVPQYVLVGDEMRILVVLRNNRATDMSISLGIDFDRALISLATAKTLTIGASGVATETLKATVHAWSSVPTHLTITASAAGKTDTLTKTFHIYRAGHLVTRA